ncbi:MAG: DM13 domain-containing protein [Chitinophagaceae bacterium]|jgi:hypothetical protein|nr:DM13 domain-containing protein [Chitinophagaceae bacterium]
MHAIKFNFSLLKILIGITISTLTLSCQKDTAVTTENISSSAPARDTILINTALQMGVFVNGVHTTSGNVLWLRTSGKDSLYLTNFKTDAGPDLKVYLSTDSRASSFVNLGDLKAFTGNQYYPIPAGKEPTDYKYVLIWCQRYSVLFGSAELK